MIAYRTAHETVDPRRFLRDIAEGLGALAAGAEARDRATGLLIDAGALEAAVSDALAPAGDDVSPLAERFRQLTLALAHLQLAAWKDDRPAFERWLASAAVRVAPLRYAPLPGQVRLRIPEGFAYYGLYPERYAAAAWRFAEERIPGAATVIGLRSIGTTLAAVVHAALEWRGIATRSLTVRPRGHPFDRRVELGPVLATNLASRPGDWFLVVDEGPGLSGSSFAGTADRLVELGVPEARVVFLPAWLPPTERLRSADARLRWRRHSAVVVSLREALGRPAPLPLEGAEDLSAGRWRALLPGASLARVPVQPQHERLKFLTAEPRGAPRVLWKFAGLGRHGVRRRERAERLGEAGFTAAPVGLTAGMLGTQFLEGTPARAGRVDQELLETAASYLAWLHRHEPAPGASAQQELARLLATNVSEGLGPRWRERAARLPSAPAAPAVALDARMFPHDWLRTSAGWRKLDALDHHDDHFLPGPTDLAWDVAGMAVEFHLSEEARQHLIDCYVRLSGDPDLPARLPWNTAAYLAFRLGYAAVAQEALGETADGAAWRRERARYRRLLADHLERHAPAPAVPVPVPAGIRLIIFDADGTLRRCTTPGHPAPRHRGEWEMQPGVRARLRHLDFGPGGYLVGIASNQDGVAYGHTSEAEARRLLIDALQAATGIRVADEAAQLCPHALEVPCDCRKPAPGMLAAIMGHYGLTPAETLFVGDSDCDAEAARRAGIRFRRAQEFFDGEGRPP